MIKEMPADGAQSMEAERLVEEALSPSDLAPAPALGLATFLAARLPRHPVAGVLPQIAETPVEGMLQPIVGTPARRALPLSAEILMGGALPPLAAMPMGAEVPPRAERACHQSEARCRSRRNGRMRDGCSVKT